MPQVVKILPTGEVVKFFGLVDANGIPYSATNPIPSADGGTVPGTIVPVTIGVADAVILTADPSRSVILMQNVSATAFIAVRSGAVAALNGAGSFVAGPSGWIVFEGAAAAAAIHAIADTAATPATVGSG